MIVVGRKVRDTSLHMDLDPPEKIGPGRVPPLKVTQGHRKWQQSVDFLLVIHSNYGPIRTVRSLQFQSKNANFTYSMQGIGRLSSLLWMLSLDY